MSHSIRHSLVVLIGVLVFFGGLANTLAKTSNSLSAEESDPNQLGWMTGFPPPAEKLIRRNKPLACQWYEQWLCQ
jgi:hypothetical protein